jgi:hypothetical protein
VADEKLDYGLLGLRLGNTNLYAGEELPYALGNPLHGGVDVRQRFLAR